MGKRAKGEGTVFQRDDGRWVGSVSLGRDDSGKRLRKTVYGKTQAEALAKLDDVRRQALLNTKAVLSSGSLAAYLQQWLETDVKVNRTDNTYREYELAVRQYINPYIGGKKLSRLDADTLLEWQGKLHRKYSENTRLRSIRVLRNALNKAVKRQ